MAGLGKRKAEVTIVINGRQEALSFLQKMNDEEKRLGEEIAAQERKISDFTKSKAELEKMSEKDAKIYVDTLHEMQDALETLVSKQNDFKVSIRETRAQMKDYQAVLDRISAMQENGTLTTGQAKRYSSELKRSSANVSSSDLKALREISQQMVELEKQSRAVEDSIRAAREAAAEATAKENADKVMGDIAGSSTKQINEAIAYYKKMQDSVGLNSQAAREYQNRIDSLNAALDAHGKKIENRRIGYVSLTSTLKNLTSSSYEQLRHAEKDLQEILRKGNLDTDERAKHSQRLASVQTELANREKIVSDAVKQNARAAKDAEIGYEGYDKVCKNLATATLAQLKRAQEDLNDAIQEVPRNTPEYEKMAQKISMVNSAVKDASQGFTKHATAIEGAISRLKSYVLVYLGFNKVMDMMRNFATGALGLSDSIADVQKVTKMAAGEVDNLSKAIDRIDSRSSQEQLHKLAYQAGLLSLSSTKDILGFVKAADQMNWALKELGEDGAVQLMKVATLTGEIRKLGVEKALTKVGSAINEITANSAANAKDVTEIVSRLGQVGSTAGYTSDQMVALASTMNSLGVKSEMGATAMQRVMVALQTNTSGIAEQLNITSDEIKNAGSSMDQLMFVLGKMNEMMKSGSGAPMEILESMFKDFGSEGVRLKSVLTSVVDNVDMLDKHLAISSAAFEDATSMLNEYEIKNETAAALVDRMGNAIRENFINSGLTRGLQTVLKTLVDLFEHTSRYTGVVYMLKAALSSVVTIGIVKGYKSLKDAVIAVVDAFKSWRTKIAENYNAMMQETIAKKANTLATKENAAAKEEEADAEEEVKDKTKESTEAEIANTVAVGGLKKAWIGLKAAFATNPFGLILTALTMLGPFIIDFGRNILGLINGFKSLEMSVEGATDAITNTNKEIWDEERRLSQLYKKLEDVKRSTGSVNEKDKERVQIIHLINARYGKYLSNQLSETANNTQIAKSLAEVNKQMRINAALKLKQQLEENVNSQLANSQGKAYESIYTNLNELFGTWGGQFKKGQNEASVSAKILSYIEEQAKEGEAGTETIKKGIKDILRRNIDGGGGSGLGEHNIKDLADDYEDLVKALKLSEQQSKFVTQVVEARAKAWGSSMQEVIDAENKATIATEETTTAIKEQNDMLKGYDIEGSLDVQKLVEWQKKLKDLANMKYGNAERARLYEMYFGDKEPKDSAKRIYDYAERVNARLKDLGYNDSGNFRYKHDGGGRSPQKQLKDEINAALAALRGYYEEQQRLEDESRIAGRITDQELVNRKRMLQEMYKIDLNELYQKLLGNQSQFDEKVYGKWFDGKDLTKLQALIKKFGSTMEDGMAANAAAAAKDAREIVVQHMATIDKVLTQYDYTGQVNKKYQSQLEDIGLFWNTYTVRNREAAQRSAAEQLKMFQDLSNRIVGLDAEGLQRLIEEDNRFAEWRKNKTLKDYEALRITLLDYHDAIIEAEKKQKARMHKIVTEQMKDRSVAQHETVKQQEVFDKLMETLVNQNLVREREAGNIALAHIQQQIQYQKELISVLRGRNASTEEEEKKLTELLKAEQEKRIAIQKDAISRVKEYTDIMQSFLTDVFSAGADDDTMTKIAEVEARKRLGLAEEEEQKKYLIYSRSGKAITQMMTEEERLRWEMENNARDRRLEATSKWIGEMGKKLSDDLTAAFASKAATSAIQQGADAEVEIQRIKTERQLEIEKTLTSSVAVEHTSRVEAAQATADAEVLIARRKKAQIDEINGVTTGLQGGGAGVKPGDDTGNTSAIDVIAPSGFSSPYGPIAPSDNEPSLLDRNINMWQEMIDNPVTNGADWCDAVMENQERMVVNTEKAFKDQELANKVANKNMARDTAAATAQMIQAFNLYGAAYNAVMDDSMTTAQKVGMFMLQSAGQVIMQMLSLSISQMVGKQASNLGEAIGKTFAELGPWGWAAIGGITAAIGASTALAQKAIKKSKKQVAEISGATDSGQTAELETIELTQFKRVAPGMLTYADGNYPVLGSDGEVYDAKRVDKWQTKIYRSPHYGILGEKGPELIVDGVTTNKMMTQRPDLYREIINLAKSQSMQRVRTYADGNYPTLPSSYANAAAANQSADYMQMMQQQLRANNEIMAMLSAQLANGITISALGDNGAVNRLNENQDWMRRHGL